MQSRDPEQFFLAARITVPYLGPVHNQSWHDCFDFRAELVFHGLQLKTCKNSIQFGL